MCHKRLGVPGPGHQLPGAPQICLHLLGWSWLVKPLTKLCEVCATGVEGLRGLIGDPGVPESSEISSCKGRQGAEAPSRRLGPQGPSHCCPSGCPHQHHHIYTSASAQEIMTCMHLTTDTSVSSPHAVCMSSAFIYRTWIRTCVPISACTNM